MGERWHRSWRKGLGEDEVREREANFGRPKLRRRKKGKGEERTLLIGGYGGVGYRRVTPAPNKIGKRCRERRIRRGKLSLSLGGR